MPNGLPLAVVQCVCQGCQVSDGTWLFTHALTRPQLSSDTETPKQDIPDAPDTTCATERDTFIQTCLKPCGAKNGADLGPRLVLPLPGGPRTAMCRMGITLSQMSAMAPGGYSTYPYPITCSRPSAPTLEAHSGRMIMNVFRLHFAMRSHFRRL